MNHVRKVRFCMKKSRKIYEIEIAFKSHQDAKKFKSLMFDDSDKAVLVGFDSENK